MKSTAELESKLQCSRRSVYRALDELIRSSFVAKDKRGKYFLTKIGKILALQNRSAIQLLSVLERHRDFWLAHDLSALPECLLNELGALKNSHIVKSDVVADSGQKAVTQELEKAKKCILAISPVTTPEWTARVVRKTSEGVRASLVISREVIDVQFREEFKKYSVLTNPNVQIRVNDSLRLAFMSNGACIGLALSDEEGLDLKNILFCRGEEAVAWGRRLFDYYARESKDFPLKE